MDVFAWSMPFLIEKIMHIMVHVISKVGEMDDEEDDQLGEERKGMEQQLAEEE